MFGEDNYGETIDHQISMGVRLKKYLEQNGWKIYNNTSLPVLCFGKTDLGHDGESVNDLVQRVIRNGKVWISVYPMNGITTIRASITNYNTTEADLQMLVEELATEKADIHT
jgi:glutamate/tyrosine decarboxylase-like PLP-dependent enzyme